MLTGDENDKEIIFINYSKKNFFRYYLSPAGCLHLSMSIISFWKFGRVVLFLGVVLFIRFWKLIPGGTLIMGGTLISFRKFGRVLLLFTRYYYY